jgi:hypothetical protein
MGGHLICFQEDRNPPSRTSQGQEGQKTGETQSKAVGKKLIRGIARSPRAPDHILSSSSIRLVVFLIYVLLAKMDPSFRRRRTERRAT